MSYKIKDCCNCNKAFTVPEHLFFQIDICEKCVEKKEQENDS